MEKAAKKDATASFFGDDQSFFAYTSTQSPTQGIPICVANWKIRTPYALQASLQIYGRRMRTYILCRLRHRIGRIGLLPQPNKGHAKWRALCLAGVAGFGPTNARVKVWCLTAWLYPKIFLCRKFFLSKTERRYYSIIFCPCQVKNSSFENIFPFCVILSVLFLCRAT